MDHDKSRWTTVAENFKKMGYEILGNDGEYLYWRKWVRSNPLNPFERKTTPPSMTDIRNLLERP
jgi:hypothetical protein